MQNQWQDIQELIQSLTPSEKGYFKKSIAGFGGARAAVYVQLFELLEKSVVADPEMIIQKLKDGTKNIQSIRNHLYEQLLKSLGAYYSAMDISSELRALLDKISILNKKGLHEQALKLVKKGLKLSEEAEMASYNLIFLTHHKQLLNTYGESEKINVTKLITQQVISNAQKILNRQMISDWHAQAIHLFNSNHDFTNKQIRTEAEELFFQLKKLETKIVSDDYARNSWHAAIALLSHVLGDYKTAIEHQEKTIQIMEKLELRKINRMPSYISALFNLGSLYILHNNINATKEIIEKMRILAVEGNREEVFLQALITQLELDVIVFERKFDVHEKINNAELFLKREHPVLNIFYDSQVRLLSYYIYTQNLQKANEKALLLMSSDYRHSQHSFEVHVRILNLIVHYKNGDFLLIPSLLRSAYRFMRKKKFTYETESIIFSSFTRILRGVSTQDLYTEFYNLKLKLTEIYSKTGEEYAVRMYFDYLWWLNLELESMKIR